MCNVQRSNFSHVSTESQSRWMPKIFLYCVWNHKHDKQLQACIDHVFIGINEVFQFPLAIFFPAPESIYINRHRPHNRCVDRYTWDHIHKSRGPKFFFFSWWALIYEKFRTQRGISSEICPRPYEHHWIVLSVFLLFCSWQRGKQEWWVGSTRSANCLLRTPWLRTKLRANLRAYIFLYKEW